MTLSPSVLFYLGLTVHFHPSLLYGKQNVDLFAPGKKSILQYLKTDISDSMTYLATPIVSGIAAPFSHIILNSGTTYDIEVIVPKDKKKFHFAII
jgi:hypothetical protein